MRLDFSEIKDATEFRKWYWLKAELVQICKQSSLPISGSKFQLQDKIADFMDSGAINPLPKLKTSSSFDWSKESLSRDTVITDNVRFGPNFRKFMKREIGNAFQCKAEFMKWVKTNIGKTLGNAIDYWFTMQKEIKSPGFKSKIADHNMFNQYLRDYLSDNAGHSVQQAQRSWSLKKQMPAKNGYVKYEKADLLISERSAIKN